MSQFLNVLIVEDEPLIKIFLKRIVKSLGHNIVGTPSSGEEALRIIETVAIDIIFMDINIKGPMNGIKVIEIMHPKNEPIIYFISAYSDEKTIEDALDTKAYNYLIKPIRKQDIEIAFSVAKKQLRSDKKDNHSIYLAENLIFSTEKKELMHNNKAVKLTKIEKKIIDVLVDNINVNVSQEHLENLVWDLKEIKDSTMRSALHGLRKKVPLLKIETNTGRGYTLVSC